MEKLLAIIVFYTCSIFCVMAQLDSWHWQEAEYHYDSMDPGGEAKILMNYWINGDTVFNGISYKKLYRECVYQDSVELHSGGLIYSFGKLFCAGIREDEQKQIYISLDDNFPTDCILYDFSDWTIGDTLFFNDSSNRTYVTITENNLDSIPLLDGSFAKTVELINKCVIIRCIGSENGFLMPVSLYPGSLLRSLIVKFYNGNQLLWENSKYVGIEEPIKDDRVQVYSVNGSLTFVFPTTLNKLELYTSSGLLIHSYINQGNSMYKIESLPKGIYLYKELNTSGSEIARGKAVVF